LFHPPVEDRVVDRLDAGWRQLDMARSVQCQHEATTDLITQLPIGLNPVPGSAHLDGKGIAAHAGVLGDEFS